MRAILLLSSLLMACPKAPPPVSMAAIPAPESVAAPSPMATTTSSGLAIEVIEPGQGAVYPHSESRVIVHYTGWTADGEMFDSSVARGAPVTLGLNQVIEGWTEGLQYMVEGETSRLWIPEDLAYKGRPGPPAGMLVFDITLIRIIPDDRPRLPSELRPTPDAILCASGLRYKILEHGQGRRSPGPDDSVTVHYKGWNSVGEVIDSSYQRGRPATFGVTKVIKGWTEGLQYMVEGDKAMLWIPQDLAYGPDAVGHIAGDLVFEIQLIKVGGN